MSNLSFNELSRFSSEQLKAVEEGPLTVFRLGRTASNLDDGIMSSNDVAQFQEHDVRSHCSSLDYDLDF